MDESTSQIEAEIRAERHRLGRNLDELETKARQLADWRTHYRQHPKLLLGLALGGGLILGAVAGRAAAGRDDDSPKRTGRRPPEGSGAGRQIEEAWQTISSALVGVAAAKVVEFVGQVVPGFDDQFNRQSARQVDSSAAYLR